MNREVTAYHTIAASAAVHGLIARGGFHPRARDAVPALDAGQRSRTVILIGNTGSSLWPAFSTSPEARDGAAHPLDRWCRRIVGAIATDHGASVRFPGDGPPWLPFVAWARRSEPVTESPIGILVHPDYGLWHAYRGALLFDREIDLPPPDHRPAPCITCMHQPCRSACPVAAFRPDGYDVQACADFLTSAPGARCAAGCGARRACPIGQRYNYPRRQQALHLDAFLVAQGRPPRFRRDA